MPRVSLGSRVVHDQRDLLAGVGEVDLGNQLADGLRVYRAGRPHADEVVVAGLHRAEDIVAPPSHAVATGAAAKEAAISSRNGSTLLTGLW